MASSLRGGPAGTDADRADQRRAPRLAEQAPCPACRTALADRSADDAADALATRDLVERARDHRRTVRAARRDHAPRRARPSRLRAGARPRSSSRQSPQPSTAGPCRRGAVHLAEARLEERCGSRRGTPRAGAASAAAAFTSSSDRATARARRRHATSPSCCEVMVVRAPRRRRGSATQVLEGDRRRSPTRRTAAVCEFRRISFASRSARAARPLVHDKVSSPPPSHPLSTAPSF